MEREINGCQQQLELTTNHRKFILRSGTERKRELLYTLENSTDSDCKQFAKTGTGCVDEVSARSCE